MLIQVYYLQVRSSYGDVRLGGNEMTGCIVNHFIDEFVRQHGDTNVRSNRLEMHKLWVKCENAKMALSTQKEVFICFTIDGLVLLV